MNAIERMDSSQVHVPKYYTVRNDSCVNLHNRLQDASAPSHTQHRQVLDVSSLARHSHHGHHCSTLLSHPADRLGDIIPQLDYIGQCLSCRNKSHVEYLNVAVLLRAIRVSLPALVMASRCDRRILLSNSSTKLV